MKTTRKDSRLDSRLAGPLALFGLLAMAIPAAAQEHEHSDEQSDQSAEATSGMMETGGCMKGTDSGMGGMRKMGRMMGEGQSMMGGSPMGGTAMPMMGGARASMILRQSEALELSAAQIAELETIGERHAAAHEDYVGEMKPLRESLSSLLEAPKPDLGRYESILREIADRQIAMRVRVAELGEESMAALTEDQRAKLRYGMRLMHGMKKMMMKKKMPEDTAGEKDR